MPPDYVLPVLIALCVFLGAWYFVGVWLNRARGIRLARTLRERLLAMEAEDLSGRWVNASIFQFVGQRAAAPIGKLAAVIVLESRELALSGLSTCCVVGATCSSSVWNCAQRPKRAWNWRPIVRNRSQSAMSGLALPNLAGNKPPSTAIRSTIRLEPPAW
jgi:hypothetical protein